MNRLDVVTSGLVPLAKTAQGATRFWEEIRRDRLGKRYKALLTGPVPVGLLEHYMPGGSSWLAFCSRLTILETDESPLPLSPHVPAPLVP